MKLFLLLLLLFVVLDAQEEVKEDCASLGVSVLQVEAEALEGAHGDVDVDSMQLLGVMRVPVGADELELEEGMLLLLLLLLLLPLLVSVGQAASQRGEEG